jgi:hypothetical protein
MIWPPVDGRVLLRLPSALVIADVRDATSVQLQAALLSTPYNVVLDGRDIFVADESGARHDTIDARSWL